MTCSVNIEKSLQDRQPLPPWSRSFITSFISSLEGRSMLRSSEVVFMMDSSSSFSMRPLLLKSMALKAVMVIFLSFSGFFRTSFHIFKINYKLLSACDLASMLLSKLIARLKFATMPRGKFIVLEGLDRTGKSSLAAALHSKLSSNDSQAHCIGFPNRKSPTGIMINDFLTNKVEINNETIHLLFSANRWECIRQVQQKLEAGINIICDRYWYSGVAYSYAKGLDLDWCMAPDTGLIQPNLLIFLKGDPQKLAERAGYGGERFERVEFQQKVAQGFDKLMKKLDCNYLRVVQLGDKGLEEVKGEVLKILDQEIASSE